MLTELNTLSEILLSGASKWFDGVSRETAGTLLTGALKRTKAEVAELATRIAADETALSKLIADTEFSTARKEKLAPKSAALKVEIATQAERLLKDLSAFIPESIWETAGATLKELLLDTRRCYTELTEQKNKDEKALINLKQNFDAFTKAQAGCESKLASASTLVVEREARREAQKALADAANDSFLEALAESGFANAETYSAALVTETELAALTKTIADYEENGKALRRDIERLESETKDKQEPDLTKLNAEAAVIKENTDHTRNRRDEAKIRLDSTARMLKELKVSAAVLVRTEKECAALKSLSDTANGKLDFETYAQMAYFEHVLRAANLRLKVMSLNRYTLLRRDQGDDGRKRTGLEIEVYDSNTGRSRSANSLSGGESFMASLSLALGLSDVVQQTAGGIHLDAMFIDEGFGSLDAEVLELSVRTLSDMAGGNRIIGIISHVAELRERIDKQVRVDKTTRGSRISLVV